MSNHFSNFVVGNYPQAEGAIPIVHTTTAHFLRSILESNNLEPRNCPVFQEKLLYFFCGKPAYKVAGDKGEAKHWELPACFIFEHDIAQKPVRIFPFDSGAHASGKLPNYIQVIPLSDFDCSSATAAPSKIIGAHFMDFERYFKRQPKDKDGFESDFQPSVFDAEIQALHTLYLDKHSNSFDDRSASIEMQFKLEVNLQKTKPLAVIVPSQYFQNPKFLYHVQNVWEAEILSYETHSLNIDSYYALIYQKTIDFYKSRGFLNV